MRYLQTVAAVAFLLFPCCTFQSAGPSTPVETQGRFALYQSYPNPFRDTTFIRYEVPASQPFPFVAIRVYDRYNALVRILVQASPAMGTYTIRWDGRDEQYRQMPPGVYIIEMVGNSPEVFRKRIVAVRY